MAVGETSNDGAGNYEQRDVPLRQVIDMLIAFAVAIPTQTGRQEGLHGEPSLAGDFVLGAMKQAKALSQGQQVRLENLIRGLDEFYTQEAKRDDDFLKKYRQIDLAAPLEIGHITIRGQLLRALAMFSYNADIQSPGDAWKALAGDMGYTDPKDLVNVGDSFEGVVIQYMLGRERPGDHEIHSSKRRYSAVN